MANRKRNIQVKFYVTAEEKKLMEQKMTQLQTKQIGAYLRKMAIDGYIIQVDTTDIKEMNKLLSAIGRNINQIAKRVNAGRPSPSRRPKQRTGKPSLLIDIQNNIKVQQSAGYKHWATIENLKRAAETLNFLTEHGIGSLEDLSERCDGAAAATARVKADLRATEREMEWLTLTMKHAATYRQLRPLYDRYRQSGDKEKFLRGHEGEIILFEAAARELKRLDAVPLPATQRLRAEMDELAARRTALQAEYKKAQQAEREYDTLRQNVEALLEQPREADQQRQRNNELE